MHCHTTIHGLNEWSQSMFEKFGWMILASNEGRTKTITGYLDSLKYLIKCIGEKEKSLQDTDNKNQMKILKESVTILHEFALKTLK